MKTIPLIARTATTLSLVALGACSANLGVDATGNLGITMNKADTSSALPAPQGSETANRSFAPDTVSSFKVTVTSVEVLHSSTDSTHAGSWASVNLRAPVTIDLMALPSDSQAAQLVARGSVEAGSYTRVRLIVTQPRIRFKGSVSFGLGSTLSGNTDYDVSLQGQSAGIETAASVKVSGDATMGLVFDQNATLSSVSMGSDGKVQLSAIFGAR